jgi:hypothetical protein
LCFVMDKQKFMQEERLQQRNLHTNINKNNSTLKIEGCNSLIISETPKEQWCFPDCSREISTTFQAWLWFSSEIREEKCLHCIDKHYLCGEIAGERNKSPQWWEHLGFRV